MKYGIMCAMDEEIALLKEDFTASRITTVAGREFYEGTLYGKPAVMVRSRIGKVAAAATTSLLIDRFGVDCVVFSGTAGGVGDTLEAGDIVVADQLIQHDFFTGVDFFRIPLLDRDYFDTDPELTRRLLEAANSYLQRDFEQDIPAAVREKLHIRRPKAVTGTIASGDQFICEKAKSLDLKARIRNLQCVEMEGAAAAQVCYEFGVPCAVVRVISDSANEESNVDFGEFVQEAACRFVRGSIRALLA